MLSRPAVASSATGQSDAFGNTSVSGPGQNAAAELCGVGVKAGEPPRRLPIGDVGNQRIECRPAFGFVEARDGAAVGRIRAEAVDGLGRKGDKSAGGKDAHRVRDRSGVGPRNACR